MLDMFFNSLKLFLKGRLFRDPMAVARQWAIGLVVTLVAMLILAKIGMPLAVAIGVSALVGGALQPWLFKDLKYA